MTPQKRERGAGQGAPFQTQPTDNCLQNSDEPEPTQRAAKIIARRHALRLSVAVVVAELAGFGGSHV